MNVNILESVKLICSLGSDESTILESLQKGYFSAWPTWKLGEREVPTGSVHEDLPTPKAQDQNTRTNQLILHCLERLRPLLAPYKPERIGVILGSSNAGITEFHQAWASNALSSQHWQRLETGNVSACIAAEIGAKGIAYTINTACSSAAKAIIAASRALEQGLCDAVITGGGDALCEYAMYGFDSLHLMDSKRVRPFTPDSNGINHGEGAALFLMTRREAQAGDIYLSGYGESSDAYHATTPEPSGEQAAHAMQQAIERAQLHPQDIQYVNMHGTGTTANDAMEINAITRVFGHKQPVASSTKPYTGHTLGAAGAIEAAICHLLLGHNCCNLPASPWLEEESELERFPKLDSPIRHCMSNSFAFGGNNVSLILSRA